MKREMENWRKYILKEGITQIPAELLIDFSNFVKRKTGIRILDPSAPKTERTVPDWGKQYPVLYAFAQTAADTFAEDPFSLALNLVPGGKAAPRAAGVMRTSKITRLGAEQAAEKTTKTLIDYIMNQPEQSKRILFQPTLDQKAKSWLDRVNNEIKNRRWSDYQ